MTSVRLLLIAAFAACVTSIHAQHLLFAKTESGPRMVKQVSRNTPFVDDGTGKLVSAEHQYLLRPAPEYLPVIVKLRDVQVRTTAIQMMDSGNQINREFHFSAKLACAVPLNDVFVVFDLHMRSSGHGIFVQEVGRLSPHDFRDFTVVAPVEEDVSAGRYNIYVFAGGIEVFNSMMPIGKINAGYARIVARRIKDVKDAPPEPLIATSPEYPAKLKRKNLSGSAVINCRISTTGEVLDPTVKSATAPEFGEAALEAARDWWFIPRVAGGRPVNTAVDLPFNFSPN
jgi:TonB family protein